MNSSERYSCSNSTALSDSSVTSRFWVTDEFSSTALASAAISLCFIAIGIPSNLLIIIGILRQRLYTQPTYIFLLNLAISDLLMCILVMPFTVISGFAGEFMFGSNDRTRCRVCQFGLILVLLAGCSLHVLAALSFDRLIFIRYPLKYHKIMTAKRAVVIVCSLWTLNFFLSILPLFGFGETVFQKMLATCTVRFISETRLAPNFYYVVVVAVVALLPLSLILFSNIWILCIVQKHIRKIYSIRSTSQNKAEFMKSLKKKLNETKHHKQVQLIKVFGAILITNFLTWIPVILRSLLAVVSSTFSDWWHFVIFSSLISFAVIHPIIQAYLIPELKVYLTLYLKKALCCQYRSTLPTGCGCSMANISENHPNNRISCGYGCYCCDILNATLLPVRDELSIIDTV